VSEKRVGLTTERVFPFIRLTIMPFFRLFPRPGNYSCLVAQFYLSRSVGFHLVQSYLPTMLIVVISWVSFWMDVDSVPGRTTLGVTTLLAVGSQSSGNVKNLPESFGYVTTVPLKRVRRVTIY